MRKEGRKERRKWGRKRERKERKERKVEGGVLAELRISEKGLQTGSPAKRLVES